MRDTSRNPFQENIGQETAFLSAAALIVPPFGCWQFANVHTHAQNQSFTSITTFSILIGWHFLNWQLFETQKSWSNQTFWQPGTESTKVQDDKKRKIIYAGWEGGERRLREIWAVWASTCLPPQTHLVPDNSRSFMPQLEVFSSDMLVESESGILVTFIVNVIFQPAREARRMAP